MNRILQAAVRGESLIISDPKSELYEKSSEYLRDQGYCVKVFNLVNPENSDSWNCLSEVEGQELMAQLFVDVIIKNTINNGKGDHFWDSCEMNLLKALVLYVDQSYAEQNRNIGEVYRLLTLSGESDLDSLFENLPPTHPAKAPYSLYKQASDTVRSGVIIGLGSRLQVFQSELIKKITTRDEIDLELPGQERCAYFLVTSDQDSTFDFLASLFLSFCFIKLVRYADKNCEGGKLPVPVHVLGEELTACGTIPDLSRRLSVIRSRNISMSCVFQNLAGLQNRYPLNLWQEILGNCDAQLFLGCTDELTAEFISFPHGTGFCVGIQQIQAAGHLAYLQLHAGIPGNLWCRQASCPHPGRSSAAPYQAGAGHHPGAKSSQGRQNGLFQTSGGIQAPFLQGIRPYPRMAQAGTGATETLCGAAKAAGSRA